MDPTLNPYAPPKAEPGADPRFFGTAEGLRREGDLLVIPVHGARFPDRCVICNQPSVKRLMRKVYWHPQILYLLICTGVLIYAIVSLIVRKMASFEVGLCDAHAKRRRNGILLGWLGFFGCLVATVAVADRAPALMFVFLIGMIALPVVGVVMVQVVTPKRIDSVNAWLKVGRPFLDSL
jgi:hypothetical protein